MEIYGELEKKIQELEEELENYNKVLVVECFESGNFIFKEGSRYEVFQDEHYVYLTDSNDYTHTFGYDELKDKLQVE